MKIMYYELIKMLIEYERNKQPEVRDTISRILQPIALYLSNNLSVQSHCTFSRNSSVFVCQPIFIFQAIKRVTGVGRKQERWQD